MNKIQHIENLERVRFITKIQNLKQAYYHEESEVTRLREKAKEHSKNKREIFDLIMKNIEEAK